MRRLARDRRGIAALELAVAAPAMGIFLLGFADVVQLGRGHLRTLSTATQIGQIVSQCEQVSKGDERVFKSVASSILGPFGATPDWALVVTAVGRDAQDKPFTWSMPATLPAIAAGAKGSKLPSDLVLKRGEVVFQTEVFTSLKTNFMFRSSTPYASVLHETRASKTDKLKSQDTANAAPVCLRSDT